MAFNFGSAPAPAPTTTSAFGATSTPAPAPNSAFSFGSTPTPAPATTSAFGATSTQAPAPNSAFSFGSTPTPAPATTSAFGATSTAFGTPAAGTTSTSTFGFASTASTTPAPTPGTGIFGTPSTSGVGLATQQQIPSVNFTGSTPYSSLPPHIKQMIDETFKIMHQHHQTMSSIESMSPSMLQKNTADADIAGGHVSTDTLVDTCLKAESMKVKAKVKLLEKSIQESILDSQKVLEKSMDMYRETFQYATWPMESCAAKHGVNLPPLSTNTNSTPSSQGTGPDASSTQQSQQLTTSTSSFDEIQQKLNALLASQASQVDRKEKVPSVYFWASLSKIQDQGNMIHEQLRAFQTEVRLLVQSLSMDGVNGIQSGQEDLRYVGMTHNYQMGTISNSSNVAEDLSTSLKNQVDAFVRIASMISHVHEEIARWKDVYKQKLSVQKMNQRPSTLSVEKNPVQRSGVGIGIAVGSDNMNSDSVFDPFLEADRQDAEKEKQLNEEVRRIVVAESIQAAPVKNNNPNTTSAFGSTPTGNTSGSGLFGTIASTPATTGTSGGLFGSTTPTTSGGGLFGSSTPTSTTGGGLFGSTGSTVASTPPTTNLFGSSTASSGGLFGASATTPAPSTSSASSRKGRKPGRRR